MKNSTKYCLLSLLFALILISCSKDIAEQSIPYSFNYEIEDTLINQIDFVKIKKGNYTYGIYDEVKSIDYDYWIMQYEVTNAQFYNFLKDGLLNKELFFKGDTIVWDYSGDDLRIKGTYTIKILDDRIFVRNDSLILNEVYAQHPVTEISWFGSTAFCDWNNFTLPDKYEWEKAARGMTGWNYPWGDSLESNMANYHNSGDPFDNGTTPVGFYNGQNYKGYQTKNSQSLYGCYDMAGNAWEYTNTTISPDKPFAEGGGGSYLYHTGAMTQSWYFSKFGYPIPPRSDRPFKADGCRCIKK